jgi:hypothetical protein
MKRERNEPPEELAAMQEAFARSIRTPFSFETGRFLRRKEAYDDAAAAAIAPRGESDGRDRLAVYNEQYWYRLLTVLQEDFPLLAAAMGYWRFNRLATAYLDRHPSRSPYLAGLPEAFGEFIRAEAGVYVDRADGADRIDRADKAEGSSAEAERMIQMAALDLAFHRAFHAPSPPVLDPSRLSPEALASLGERPLPLQPWLDVVREDWNLMENRIALAEGRLEKPAFRKAVSYWAVYRNGDAVEWQALDPERHAILSGLKAGLCLGDACMQAIQGAREAGGAGEGKAAVIQARLPGWFETWTRQGWFGAPSTEPLVEG